MDVLVPNYYTKFNCAGSACEDTCCSGWSVDIDRETFHRYRNNKHPELAPVFKMALSRQNGGAPSSDGKFGKLLMKPGGDCYFLQEDRLCRIHNVLGHDALSHTCSTYPRYRNLFGSQRENSLAISCPEAARLILLNPEPITFDLLSSQTRPDSSSKTSYRFPLSNEGDPEQIAILNDFRAVIIGILQHREIDVGTRLMVLGFLLEDADKIISSSNFSHASQLIPVMQSYVEMLSHRRALETQFGQIQSDIARKIEVISRLILNVLSQRNQSRFSDTLQSAVAGLQGDMSDPSSRDQGLVDRYAKTYDAYYRPYMAQRDYVFENYLVNQVVTRLFPFTRGTYLDLYREMVFNIAILQLLLLGVSAHKRGLNDGLLIEVFQGYARKSDHDRQHIDNLSALLCGTGQNSFSHVMWMLKDSV